MKLETADEFALRLFEIRRRSNVLQRLSVWLASALVDHAPARSGGPLGGLSEVIGNEAFGDLHGVECRAFAEVVGDHPQRKSVLDCGVGANSADIDEIVAGAFDRRNVALVRAMIDHGDAWRTAQRSTRLFGRDRLLELNIDRFRMTDEDRHPDTGRMHFYARVEDLLG